MKPSSAKAKGRRLQDHTRDRILHYFLGRLEADDVRGAIMGESGTDIKLSPLARRLFPYDVECKNQERLNIWAALEQATQNATGTPCVVFTRNRAKVWACLPLDEVLRLVMRAKGLHNVNVTVEDE